MPRVSLSKKITDQRLHGQLVSGDGLESTELVKNTFLDFDGKT